MTTPDLFFKDLAPRLLANGYEVLPIKPGEKIPRIQGWSELDVGADQIDTWARNGRGRHYVGLRTGRAVAVDIDIDDPEVTAFVRADAELMLGDGPVRYGRPGRALMLYGCEGEEGRKKSVRFLDAQGHPHQIEVLQRGQQFVAYGLHPDERAPYTWENGEPSALPVADLPQVTDTELAEWLRRVADEVCQRFGWSIAAGQAFDADEAWLLAYRPPQAVETMGAEERVQYEAMRRFAEWVPELFPDAREYQGGYRVTSEALGRDLEEDLALHPGGIRDHGEETGMTPLQVVAKWRFDGDNDAAMAWLANRLGVDVPRQARAALEAAEGSAPVAQWLERVAAAETADRLQRVAEGVARNRCLTEIDRERLARAFQARFRELTETPIGIAAVRKTMRPRGGEMRAPEPVRGRGWWSGWYYVTHVDKFYRYGSDQWVTSQGFNALFQREMPPEDDGRRPSAVRAALDDMQIPVVEVGMYCPQYGERFSAAGRDCVNTFNPASVPPADEVIDSDGSAAVEAVQAHILNLCGGRQKVAAGLLDWITYAVRHPGRKIRYAPLIKGIEGDGKTLLLELCAACLGEPNIRTVGPAVVTSQFNGFAEGRCIVGLEELRMVGHNRYDAANAIKPLITNNTVDIHKKGQDSYNILNVTNYAAFTNHGDALPISDTDRRYFVIFTPWNSVTELEAFVGESAGAYFDRMHGALQYGGALRRWLLDRELSPEFNPNGHAPYTPEKAAMRAADADDDEQTVLRRIELGGEGVSDKAVATDCLARVPGGAEFVSEELLSLPRGRALAKTLQKLGWTHYPKQLKWHGSPRRVWVKGLPLDDNEAVRHELDKTIGEDAVPF